MLMKNLTVAVGKLKFVSGCFEVMSVSLLLFRTSLLSKTGTEPGHNLSCEGWHSAKTTGKDFPVQWRKETPNTPTPMNSQIEYSKRYKASKRGRKHAFPQAVIAPRSLHTR